MIWMCPGSDAVGSAVCVSHPTSHLLLCSNHIAGIHQIHNHPTNEPYRWTGEIFQNSVSSCYDNYTTFAEKEKYTFPTRRAFFFKAGEVWLLDAFSSVHPPSQRAKKIAYSHTIKIRHFRPHVMYPSPLIIPSNMFFFFLFRQFGYIELENLFLMPHAAFFSSEQALIFYFFSTKSTVSRCHGKFALVQIPESQKQTNKQTSLDNFTIPITCGKEKSS